MSGRRNLTAGRKAGSLLVKRKTNDPDLAPDSLQACADNNIALGVNKFRK